MLLPMRARTIRVKQERRAEVAAVVAAAAAAAADDAITSPAGRRQRQKLERAENQAAGDSAPCRSHNGHRRGRPPARRRTVVAAARPRCRFADAADKSAAIQVGQTPGERRQGPGDRRRQQHTLRYYFGQKSPSLVKKSPNQSFIQCSN